MGQIKRDLWREWHQSIITSIQILKKIYKGFDTEIGAFPCIYLTFISLCGKSY